MGEKLEVQSKLIFQSPTFQSLLSMNWEKLRSPARATFKNPNFKSLGELSKTWKCSLSPRFESPNFESIDELGKVMI